MLNENNLRSIGFTTEGTELGDEGALELYDLEDNQLFIWQPNVNGQYITPEHAGFYICVNYEMKKLPHIKNIQQVKDLYKLLTGKNLKTLKKVKKKITKKIEYYA